jgi:hypothetical protein
MWDSTDVRITPGFKQIESRGEHRQAFSLPSMPTPSRGHGTRQAVLSGRAGKSIAVGPNALRLRLAEAVQWREQNLAVPWGTVMSETKPKRRWFRFSLRMLLVAMTTLCIWLGFKVAAARRQKEAVAVTREAGGYIFFDDEMVPIPGQPGRLAPYSAIPAIAKRSIPEPAPPGPAWLRDWLGDEYFRNIYEISIGDQHFITEADLRLIVTLPSVRIIFLTNPKIVAKGSETKRALNDSDLAAFENLRQLRELVLESHDITNVGIKHLRNLTNLELLSLYDTDISDAGLQYLGGLVNLKHLKLRGSRVTSEGIHELQKELPNMRISGP